MRRLVSLLLLSFLVAAPAAAQSLPEKSDQVVQYQIRVALDPGKRQLTGTERLTWRNPSTADSVSELQFHLYLNAFKNTKSTFVKESGGQLRGDQMGKDSWGWIDVVSIKTASGADLKPTLAFIQPDDGNKDDQTVARVVLPEPVPPGGSVTLDITFTSMLPRVFARTGYKDDFYLVGQWFPKLGVYEPAAPGFLKVLSRPKNAAIYINGELQYEKTPFTFDRPPGQYTVRIVRIIGGKELSHTRTVTLESDETEIISHTFEE
jgi:hypothetical protein